MNRKNLLKTICLGLLLVYGPVAFGQQKKAEIAPEYYTPYGVLTITLSGSQVTASYPHENGRIIGRLEGNLLQGTWQQDDGSGSILLTFSPDFSTFKGRYNHRQSPEKWSTDWSGMRKPQIVIRRYKTSWGILTCNFEGTQVSASYPWFNGKILGEVNGNAFTGIWLQSNRGIGTLKITFSRDWTAFRGRYNDFNFHPKKWFKWEGKLQP